MRSIREEVWTLLGRLGTQLERRSMANDFVPEVQRGGAAKTIVVKEIP
jgi:hypothetical protein